MEKEGARTASGDGGGAATVEQQVQVPPALDEKRQMKVMVAIDDSDGSFYALQWALDKLFPASPVPASAAAPNEEMGMVVLIHVFEPFNPYVIPAGPGGSMVYATPAMVDSVKKGQRQNATLILARALDMCKTKMIKAETLIMEGDPKDMICQAAEQMHVDLLVLGSRGLGMIKRAFLGSVSDYCAHHSKCPILIVRPPKHSI
ncbi:hypothetical protein NMG60_11001604 [Bertholletia excelsa]